MSDAASSGIFVLEDALSGTSLPLRRETVAAFVGPAPRGPVDIPVAVRSVAEYLKRFGASGVGSRLEQYLARFFDNGGTLAIVVRACRSRRRNQIHLPTDDGALVLEALHPGPLEYLRASVDYDGIPADAPAHFNLTVHRLDGGDSRAVIEQEIYPAVSAEPDDPDYVGHALLRSGLLRLRPGGPATRPLPTLGAGSYFDPGYVYADGTRLPAEVLTDYDLIGCPRESTGLYALEQVARIDLLCIVSPVAGETLGPVARFAAERYCQRRQALLLVEPPGHWQSARDAVADPQRESFASPNVVTCFPLPGDGSVLGALAGRLAAQDQGASVWSRSPDGKLRLRCAWRPPVELTPAAIGALVRAGVNPITAAEAGWLELHGAVTTARGTGMAPEWCDLRSRRTTLFIVSSIVHQCRWSLFGAEPATAMSALRERLTVFLQALRDDGALTGRGAGDAWFLRGPVARDAGLELVFGIALTRPREFLEFRITQRGGDTQVREFGWQPAFAAAV
jgi:hypothetical protein